MEDRDQYKMRRPLFCKKCGGEMKPIYSGAYECKQCKQIELDDFGKVKAYIEEHGKQPAVILSEKTGVGVETIEYLLRSGRLEIPENSDVYIQCERCGCDIRYGRFCPECMKILSGDVKKAFFNEALGEKPKKKRKDSEANKMHIMDWIEKKSH